jgi:cyclophilin family peptidyl-prolyl cis-trans isomerase
VISKVMAFGAAAFLALPLLAQATGPQGLAEPYIPPVKAAPDLVAPPADPANIINIELSSGGTVSVLLRPDKAPLSIERLKVLTNRGFYNGLTFHRVIDGFMAQTGDPKGDGSGGSDLPDLKAEFNDLPHLRGVMAMARADQPNSANSQFYIMLSPNLTLDRRYTVVGRVISGMGNVDRIEKGEPPLNPSRMTRVYFGAPPADPSLPAPSATVAPRAVAPPVLPSGPISAPPATPPRKRTGKQ